MGLLYLKFTTVFVLLISSFLYPNLSHGQIAGDAAQFTAGSFFALSVSGDSLDKCTIELWVKPLQNLDTIYLFYIGEDNSSGFGLYATTLAGAPEEYAEIQLGGVIASATGNQARLPLNRWTHLAMTRSGNIWKLYKNGALVGRGNRIAQVMSQKLVIGKGFSGMMDEVRLWKRELSQDEIRSVMSQSLQGNEQNLRFYYVMDMAYRKGDSVLLNKVTGATHADDARLVSQGLKPTFVQSSIPLYPTPIPRFIAKNFPSHMQFFARNNNGFAPIEINGSVDQIGYDSIILKKWKNDLFVERWSAPTHYIGSSATFGFVDSIYAERSQYTYTLSVVNKNSEFFLAEAADLVAGDAFYIAGQSNAHPAISWYSNVNPFFRTFGVQTTNLNFDDYDLADTSWGYGNGHGFGELFSGPYLIGVWANKLEGNILTSYGIPTCIINGAAGGSTIEQNLPNDTSHTDLSTIYGRAFYRSVKSGLRKKYHALFWYQGEYNSIGGYYNNFRSLYHNWFRDFGDSNDDNILKKIYVFQIHPGCVPGERSALRELQRTIPDSLPHIEVMSTCGVSGHDDCHYDAFGYWHIADNISRLVAHDIYGSIDTVDILPPNIKKANYADSNHDIIVLEFANAKQGLFLTHDTIIAKKLRQLTDYFYLDSLSGNLRVILVHGDSLILYLSHASGAKFISYLPDETYYNDDTDIYEGPWVLNNRGIGALSFNNFPISPYVHDTTSSSIDFHKLPEIKLQCAPNPVISSLTISYILFDSRPIQLEILNLLGKTVLPLEKYSLQQFGEYTSSYDLSTLSAGEYFVRMTARDQILTQKIILIK